MNCEIFNSEIGEKKFTTKLIAVVNFFFTTRELDRLLKKNTAANDSCLTALVPSSRPEVENNELQVQHNAVDAS